MAVCTILSALARLRVIFLASAASAVLAMAFADAAQASACAPPLRVMPHGDAAEDAGGAGQMFESIAVTGVTDVRAATNSGVLADFDGDHRIDVLLIQSAGSVSRPQGRMRLLLNTGCFSFEPHDMEISGSAFGAERLGAETQIANVADFNKDGFFDILLTRSRGLYDSGSTGNTLFVSQGRFDRFIDVGAHFGIGNAQAYNRATAIGDLNGDGWLDFAVGADNIGNTRRYGVPRHRLFIYEPASSGQFMDGAFNDVSGSDLVPDFPGEFACNPRVDRAGPLINFRDLDNDGDLDIIQSYHDDMNGAGAQDPCASGEYRTGVWVWRNLLADSGRFQFERVEANGLAEEGRAAYNDLTERYATVTPAMSLPYIFSGDVNNDGLLDLLAVGPTDPSWSVKTDPAAARFWLNNGRLQFTQSLERAGLGPLNWTYSQWADFWGVELPQNSRFFTLACTVNQLQTPICADMRVGDYQFYHASAILEDFNNDGAIDILVADRREADGMWGLLRNMLFLGDGEGRFRLISTQVSGIDSNSIAMQAADLNNDGLLDLVFFRSPHNSYVSLLPAPPLPEDRHFDAVYWNTGAHGAARNHWLEILVTGVDHAAVIGARVEILNAAGRILGSRQIHTTQTYKAGGDLRVHFGLGRRNRAAVRVTLPGGEQRIFDALGDGLFELNMASGEATRIDTQ